MTWDIVGMSAICALGETVPDIHAALCAGRSGLAPVAAFDRSRYRAGSAYEVPDRADPGRDEPLRTWTKRQLAAVICDRVAELLSR